jgi:hypothetical protein
LLRGRWNNLSSLTLNSLWCSEQGIDLLASFLASHANLEVLHLNVTIGGNGDHSFLLPPNSLPRLRELKTNKEVANVIMECAVDRPRPLETIKGIKLSGLEWDRVFLKNLKNVSDKITKIELSGWNDMEDIRRLAECVPKLAWLDLGKRYSSHDTRTAFASNVVRPFPQLVIFELRF